MRQNLPVKERKKSKKDMKVKPDWKDFLAISIAALETVFLPTILLIVIFVVLGLLIWVIL